MECFISPLHGLSSPPIGLGSLHMLWHVWHMLCCTARTAKQQTPASHIPGYTGYDRRDGEPTVAHLLQIYLATWLGFAWRLCRYFIGWISDLIIIFGHAAVCWENQVSTVTLFHTRLARPCLLFEARSSTKLMIGNFSDLTRLSQNTRHGCWQDYTL